MREKAMQAIVYLSVTHLNDPSFTPSWKESSNITKSTSSGFVVLLPDGRKAIVTNKHCINKATCINGKFPMNENNGNFFNLEVAYENHEVDLAILVPSKGWEHVLDSVEPLTISQSNASTGTQIMVCGFPGRSDQVVITAGVITSYECKTLSPYFTHPSTYGKIDAMTNFGNSGGPVVVQENEIFVVVGVSVRKSNDPNTPNQMIPSSVLNEFIRAPENFLSHTSFSFESLDNLNLRRHLLPNEDIKHGVLVTSIPNLSNAQGYLEKKDVILEINGCKVNSAGLISHPDFPNQKISLKYAFCFPKNQDVSLKIIRNKEELDITIPYDSLKNNDFYRTKIVPSNQKYGNKSNDYLIVGGICIEPLTYEFLGHVRSLNKNKETTFDALVRYENKAKKGERIFIITQVLEIKEKNDNYDGITYLIVDSINGKEIHTLKDLIQAIFENKEDNHIIETKGRSQIVVVPNSNEFNEELKKQYHFSEIYSPRVKEKIEKLYGNSLSPSLEILEVKNELSNEKQSSQYNPSFYKKEDNISKEPDGKSFEFN